MFYEIWNCFDIASVDQVSSLGLKAFVWPQDVKNYEHPSELQENMFSETILPLANPLDGMNWLLYL